MIAPSSVFVYGTLMAPQVLKVLIGRVPDLHKPAILQDYRRHPVRNEVFPGMIHKRVMSDSTPCSTTGLLLQGLSDSELSVLDWFEGDEYVRHFVRVQVLGKSFHTQCYVWGNPLSELNLTQEWQYDNFRKTKLDWYLTNSVRQCRSELDDFGIGKYE